MGASERRHLTRGTSIASAFAAACLAVSCASDPAATCGDGACGAGEARSCPGDCAACGDGICQDPAENPYRCERDCTPECDTGPCWLPDEAICNECMLREPGSVTLTLGPYDLTTTELARAVNFREPAIREALAAAGETGHYDFTGAGTVWAARSVNLIPGGSATISVTSTDGSHEYVLACTSPGGIRASDHGEPLAVDAGGCFGCTGVLVLCVVGASPIAGVNPDPYGSFRLSSP